MQKKVSVVIPVMNRYGFTKACLEALGRQTWKNLEVIVVDDGSTDETKTQLKVDFPWAKVVFGDGEYWWTKATNEGIKVALKDGTDYVMTLNNDTVPPENFVEKLVEGAESAGPKALVGAMAINQGSGEVVYGGEIMDWLRAGRKSVLSGLSAEKQTGLHEVTHFPGRGLLIPISVFDAIGLYDEKTFPHYSADYDFTLRARKKGYKVYCSHDARLEIYPEASGDKQNRKKKSLKAYYNHLFTRRGGGNAGRFLKFAVRNCPPQYMVPYIAIGLTKKVFGYLIEWVRYG